MPLQSEFVKRLQAARASFLEVVVVAVLLAFSVAVLATVAFEELGNIASLFLGLVLAAACFCYIVARNSRNRDYEAIATTAIIIERESNSLVRICGHEAIERMADYLDAGFAENPALLNQWQTQSLAGHALPADAPLPDTTGSRRILTEVAEYLVLETLSTHLSDFYRSREWDKGDLKVYRRGDIPDVLLSNRFLELFTREPMDRTGFFGPVESNIVMTSAPGRYFYRFELTLPSASRISRQADGRLLISSSQLDVYISVGFSYVNIPLAFIARYLKKKPIGMNSYGLRVTIAAHAHKVLRPRAKDWKYHAWLDAYMDNVREEFDFAAFLQRVGWDQIEATLVVASDDGRPWVNE
ncbi:hypothetical protein [Streptomyces sp. NBC_01207]|uniref:hypothetical protein n=1 Tax=Streptomyces sp. NBC_01207 TaxID=2903772 RepID=UPI002E1028D8|nr:hypothetical protein OG457_37670 [Streptomyces sp. NBC_01207]